MRWIIWLSVTSYLQFYCTAFVVLPFVQIDFTHYFRLAQCEAKCAEKHGTLIRRRLHDGNYLEFVVNNHENAKICETGCNKGRAFVKKSIRSLRESLQDGIHFWSETRFQPAKLDKSGVSPIRNVRVGCMNIASIEDNDLEDSVESLVFIDLSKKFDGPMRFVIQWKHRTVVRGKVEESNWITASIESEPVFKVEGMTPSAQYRFQVTAVGSKGRLGSPVTTAWIESLSLGNALKSPVGPLQITPKYDSDNGVSALVSWSHLNSKRDSKTRKPDGSLKLDSCYFRIATSNSTHQQITNFLMDNGSGFLLSHLEFATEYTVALSALAYFPSSDREANAAPPLQDKFTTLGCNEVFGAGSLNCPPEPVQRMRVQLHPNGTADIEWLPPSDPNSILIYQLFYGSVTNDLDCLEEPVNTYLNSAVKSTRINLPARKACEYLVRLTNYDLIGRDAVSEIKVWYRPQLATPNSNFLLIVIPASVIIFLIIILKLSSYLFCQQNTKKITLREKSAVPIL